MALSRYKSFTRADLLLNNQPGYTNQAWLAPKSAFTILQEPAPAAGAALGEAVTISTAHTFPVGEGFIQVYCAPKSVEGPGTIIGADGSKRFKWEPKILLLGDGPELLEQILMLINDDLVLLLKDATCPGNQILQFGCSCNPSQVSAGGFASSNTGDETGQKGYTLTLTSYCKYFYNSTIAEKPAA